MSIEEPLVNGIPLSSLRVVDLRDELEKRGLSKIGNKSVLTERLKVYMCENELQTCDENTVKARSTTEMSTENPLVTAYLARQAEVLEVQKRDAERIRKEQAGDDSHTDEADEVTSPKRSKPNTRQKSESLNESMETVEQSATGSADEQGTVEPSKASEESENTTKSARISPLGIPDKQTIPVQETEVDEINDEEIEKAVSVEGEPEEDKQSDDEGTQYSKKNSGEKEKTLGQEVLRTPSCENDVDPSKNKASSASTAKPVDENGGDGSDHLEELDYGEVDAEADADAEDKEPKGEIVEVDESEDREIQKQRRQLVMALEGLHDGKNEMKRKVSPSRHPESEIIHIRGLTRPFTDRALKGEIMKCGGQIVDFWIDNVKSHCIVQMGSIHEAREVRDAMHNTQWPVANPKTLSVQFDTRENLERHRSGITAATSSYPISTTRLERKPSERERPTIGHLPGRNPSLKITVEAAMRENEKREESKEKERRERARTEKEVDIRREGEGGRKEKHEEKPHDVEKHTSKRDEHDRKRRRSETPPFSRSVTEKRERRDSYGRPESDREYGRKRDDRGRYYHYEIEKEKEREEKPVKTADSLFMKTKTQPAIYFLPLTDEEVTERQEMLLAEKKKREQKEQEREKEKEKSRR